MFNTLLNIQNFLEAFYHSVISLLRVLFRLRFRPGFKNITGGADSIIILANGPSLRKDLDRHTQDIASCRTMGVNLFALSDDFEKVKPGYYTIVDVVFLKEQTLERVMQSRNKIIQALREKLSWEMILFLPYEGKNSYFHKQLAEANLPLKFIFFNRTSIDGLKPIRHFMYSLGWGMPPPQNVLVGALMIALQSGFKRIFVLGADHSWHEEIYIEENGEMTINDKHFYNLKGKKLPKHHGESLKQFKIHDYFNELSRTFRSHTMVEEYARSRGVEIINGSSRSYIDAYRKIRSSEIPWDQIRER